MWLIIFVFIVLFGAVLAVGAPYLPTMSRQAETALDLMDLHKGQVLLDLGSGDGRVLRAAARRGLSAVGYELNPLLVLVSWVVTLRYRKQVKIIWGNYWQREWPKCDGVYAFILPKYMGKLNTKLMQYAPTKFRVATYAFTIPGRKPTKHKNGIYLYEY